tara:strand:+ start:7164 stop:7616 length:453 start_codon:yes stop_codon:yes gene_type:complete
MKLKPTLSYCALQMVKWAFLLLILFVVVHYFPYPIVKSLFGVFCLVLVFTAFYKFLLLRSITYEFANGQIKYTFGIFSKKTEYLELFRVRDLTQKQGLIDQIISTMKIDITSDDKTHPIFSIEGIPKSAVTESIREAVLQARKDNRIFEV